MYLCTMTAGVVPIVNDSGGPREDILARLDAVDVFGQPRRAGVASACKS